MGKTYTEIIDMYGEFDFINGEVSENGIFSNGEAAYVISEDWLIDLVIKFDKDGKACEVGKSYDGSIKEKRTGDLWNNQVYKNRYKK